MLTHTRRARWLIPAFVLACAIAPRAQSAADDAADAEWLVRTLGVQAGSTVGEIGAGSGELTVALAKVVGDTGRVYSNELNKDRLPVIAKAAESAGLKNVTTIDGRPLETNFPEQCCDAIFMRSVYHHFGDPPAMNSSVLASLKPGGRLAVIDFSPNGSENLPGHRAENNHHGVTAATVERELTAVGFEIVSSATEDHAIRVVARRPPR